MRTLLLSVLLVHTACIPGISPTRDDDPDNPPDTAIEGTVVVDDVDTFYAAGRYFTSDPELTLQITFAGSATSATITVNGVTADAEDDSATTRTLMLDGSTRLHTILVTFWDLAEHQGTTARIDVELDVAPPAVDLFQSWILTDDRPTRTDGSIYPACAAGAQTTSEPIVDVSVAAEDDSLAALEIRLAGAPGCTPTTFADTDSFQIFGGIHRVLLSGESGGEELCAQVRDAAHNVSEVVSIGTVRYDAGTPTSPRLTTQTTVVDADAFLLTFTQSSDTEGNLAGYELLGGAGLQGTGEGANAFTLCDTCMVPGDPSGLVQVTVALLQSSTSAQPTRRENLIRVRAIDCASNVSDDDFRFLAEDSRTPDAPENLRAFEENGAVVLRWNEANRELDADVVGYRIYYGTVSRDFSGTFAEEGPSPVSVSAVGSFRLTGIPNGTTVYVSVTAIDEVEWVQVPTADSTCSSAVRTPEAIGDGWYCREEHESAASEEIAVLANEVTPEPLDVGTVSASWHRAALSPDRSRLLVSAGSAVMPFSAAVDGSGHLSLQDNNQQPLASEFLSPANPISRVPADGSPIVSSGFTDDIAFSDSHQLAYVANGNKGVLVISVPTDAPATSAGSIGNPANFSREVEMVHWQGEDALVVAGDRGLQLFELSDPDDANVSATHPKFAKTAFSNKAIRAMVWDPLDGLLYVSLFQDGIAVLDGQLNLVNLGFPFENPFCPALFSLDDEPRCDVVDIERVTLSGAGGAPALDVLLLADADFGLSVVDVTAFVGSWQAGGQTTASPEEYGQCHLEGCFRLIQPGTLRAIEVAEPYIFALGSRRTMIGGGLADGGAQVGPDVIDDVVAGGDVIETLFAQNNGLYDTGLRFPESAANPVAHGEGWVSLASAADFEIIDNTILVAQRNLGLKAYELRLPPVTGTPPFPIPYPDLDNSDPGLTVDLTPATTGSCVRPIRIVGNARKLAITGSRLLVADREAGAQVLSLQNPAQPVHEVELPMGKYCTVAPAGQGQAVDVATTGPFAFVATTPAGVRVVDLRQLVGSAELRHDLPPPAQLGQLAGALAVPGDNLTDLVHDGALPAGPGIDPYPSGLVARVAARRDRMWMLGFDTGSLAGAIGPGALDQVHLKLFAWSLAKLYDNAGFLDGPDGSTTSWSAAADQQGALDLGRPELLGSPEYLDGPITAELGDALDLDDTLTNLEVNGDFLYFGVDLPEFAGVLRVQADPSGWPTGMAPPALEGLANVSWYENAAPRQIKVRGTVIYVADANRGLVLLDEPTGELLATLNPKGQARSLAVEGNLAYLGTSDGLQVVDVELGSSSSVSLRTVGFVEMPAPVLDVLVRGSIAYLATAEAGVRLVELADAASPEPFSVAPFAEEDGSSLGAFSVSGAVAYLISEGWDIDSRDDNLLLTVDLRAPDQPLTSASTTARSPGVTHVDVDGQSLYVSSRVPRSGQTDSYEPLGGGANNDISTQATPITTGELRGALVSYEDVDWYLLQTPTPSGVQFLNAELATEGFLGEVFGDLVVDTDCDPSATITVDEMGEAYRDGASLGPALFLVGGEPPQPFEVAGDGSGTLCVYVHVFSPVVESVQYLLRLGWPDYQTCTSPDAFAGNDTCATAQPIGSGGGRLHLCAPGGGGAELFRVDVPARTGMEVLTAVDAGGQQLSLEIGDAACPFVAIDQSMGPAPVHSLFVDNLSSDAPRSILVRVTDADGAQDSMPYRLETFVFDSTQGDYFDRDPSGPPVRLVSGRYFDLHVPGGDTDTYEVRVADGQRFCASVSDTVGLGTLGISEIRDGAGAVVTAVPGMTPLGEDCEEGSGALIQAGGGAPDPGVFRVTVTNPAGFGVDYVMSIIVDDDGWDLFDSGDTGPIGNEDRGEADANPFARIPAMPAVVEPMYVGINDPDWFRIRIEKQTRVTIVAVRDPTSQNELELSLVDQNGLVAAFPISGNRFTQTLDFINEADTDLDWYVRVQNLGDDDPGYGDRYSLVIEVADGADLFTRVEAFNAAPFGLIPAGESEPRAAAADALASWGPYGYYLAYNQMARLFVTRFSDFDNSAPRPPIDFGDATLEGEIELQPSPRPPFTMVAEGPRIFVLETDSSRMWFVDVLPVLSSSGEPANVHGPWQLFTAEAPTIDGVTLHGGKLFVANAARGTIYALDVATITTHDTWLAREGTPEQIIAPAIEAVQYPVIGHSVSTNVAGSLALGGFRLLAGLVGSTPEGLKSVGTALFDLRSLWLRPAGDDSSPLVTFSPNGAATVGAFDLQLVGPYLYLSNENGYQVLDLR